MATIADVVTNLQSIGIFKFFLPFIILFAVFYGLLSKTKIFGDPKETKGINAVVAFAAAAFIMLYPTTNVAVFQLTDYLANFVGGTLIYIFGILAFLVVMFMIATPLGMKTEGFEKKAGVIGASVAGVLIIALFFSSGGTLIFPGVNIDLRNSFTGSSWYPSYIDPTVLALVIVLVVMALAVWWVVK